MRQLGPLYDILTVHNIVRGRLPVTVCIYRKKECQKSHNSFRDNFLIFSDFNIRSDPTRFILLESDI